MLLLPARWPLAIAFAGLALLAQRETEKPFPGQSRVRLSIRATTGPTGVRLRVTNAGGQ